MVDHRLRCGGSKWRRLSEIDQCVLLRRRLKMLRLALSALLLVAAATAVPVEVGCFDIFIVDMIIKDKKIIT